MPGKKGFPLIAAFLLVFLLCLRLFLLTADPPYDLSTSGGPYGDPGGYSFNARNKVLFGTWEVDDYNMMHLSFPPHLMTYLSFKVLGVGLAQQNLVPVLFSMGILVLFFLILRDRFSYVWALGGTLLLGLNYLFLMYSRVANRVMPPLFFILLGLFFLQKKGHKAGYDMGAGTSFFLALISKSVIFYVLGSIGIAYLAFSLLYQRVKETSKHVTFLAMGVLAPGILWFLFIYIPHRDFIHSFSELNVKFLIPRAHLPTLLRNFWTRPPILLEHMPIVCVLAALGSLVLLSKLTAKVKLPLIDWIFLLWFLSGYAYYAVIQQRVSRHVIPQIIPLIFLTVSFGYHGLNDSSTAGKKRRPIWGVLLFMWLLFPVSMGLKFLAKPFPQIFSGQGILNLMLLALSAGIVLLSSVLSRMRVGQKRASLSSSTKRAFLFVLLAAVLAIQGYQYGRWALHPQFQFKHISQDLGKALPEATIAGLWAPIISLENKHRAHEYFPGAINDYPDFFQRFGITHVFTTTHAGEDKKFEANFPEVMGQAKLLARYHIWRVEALLYDIHPTPTQTGQEAYEAELYTQKGCIPRFDPSASGAFAVLCSGKKPRFAVSIPRKNPLSKGTYTLSFRMKKLGRVAKAGERLARIDAVSEKRKKALSYKDIFPFDLDDAEYRLVKLTLRLDRNELITFRIFSQGNGSLWVDRVDVQKID